MVGAFALLSRMRFWSLLLLAAIGMQAAEPIRAPLERALGSAFSAATLDVALSTARKSHGASATTAQPLPLPRVALVAEDPVPAPRFALASPSNMVAEARGPPPRRHPARLPDSTAPPIA